MAASLWKTPFWQRMDDLHQLVIAASTFLISSSRHLALPMRADVEERGLAMIKPVEEGLIKASKTLLLALTCIGSVEVLSVCNIRNEDGEEQRALTNVRAARTHLKSEYDIVVRSLGHLWTAASLIGHPCIPDVDAYINAERLAAITDVDAAFRENARILGFTNAVFAAAAAFFAGAGN